MSQLLSNPAALLLIAVALILLGVVAARYLGGHAPTAAEKTLEADAFQLLTRAVQTLADTSAEDAAISAANQRKALKAAQLDHARTVLAGLGTGPQPPAQG